MNHTPDCLVICGPTASGKTALAVALAQILSYVKLFGDLPNGGSITFAAAMGVGVAFAALPILLYQGGLTLIFSAVGQGMDPAAVTEMSAVGGLLIMGIGVNMLLEKDIKVANLLPAIMVPFLYFPLYDLIMR